MKMYGDHHILSHLWHDWLPKVYHCSNRWCPWHCHYCPFIILICPPALHPNSSDGQHIHTKLLYLWTQQKRTKWIPIPILCQFGMHELLFWLTYRLAILDWEFDQKSSSLNHHPLNWIPEVSLLAGNRRQICHPFLQLTRTNISRCCDFGLHEDLKREIVWRFTFKYWTTP